jgi:23S rRNA (guanosine2251-2'-O)-methyltransferase
MDRIEGRHAVEELLRSGTRVRSLRVLDAPGKDAAPLDRIVRMAAEAGVPVERVGRRELDRDSERGAHQGVIAVAEPFRYAPLEALLSASGTGPALILALDHVMDPGNLGAVVRTADVVGAAGVIIAKDRSAEMTPSAYKAAAGAAEHLPIAREPNLSRALEQCKEAGFWVAGASEHAEKLAWDAPIEGRLVLVLGAEGTGLSRLVERGCDMLVRLPVAGSVGSLNVSNAAAVLAYEWLRRQRA